MTIKQIGLRLGEPAPQPKPAPLEVTVYVCGGCGRTWTTNPGWHGITPGDLDGCTWTPQPHTYTLADEERAA